MHQLIDNVRDSPNDETTVKAVGYACSKTLEIGKMEERIAGILGEQGIRLEEKHVLLGGNGFRRARFNPKTGELTTYFSCGRNKKTI